MIDAGMLLIDKAPGMTSHDVVDILRRVLGIRRIGHSGTLDPDATGLLIMLINRATKSSARFLGMDKTYEAVLTLGVTTATQDASGDIIDQMAVPDILRQEMLRVLQEFIGDTEQIPPMVSAKKVKGKKLYQLARKGIEIKREPRPITIHELKLQEIQLPQISFTVRCSKGTYVRTLCHDIGQRIGCGGHMSSLRRTAIGDYKVENAITIEDLKRLDRDNVVVRMRDVL